MRLERHRVKLDSMVFETLIDVQTLRAQAASPQLALVDCRFDLSQPDAGRQAYLEAHIPGAVYADLNRDLSSPVTLESGRHPLPDPQILARRLGELGIGDDTQVIAYDQANGSFAARLWWLLRWLGHPQVAVLDGGFTAWNAAGGATQSGQRAVKPRHLTPRAAADGVLSTAQVGAALRNSRALLVDARAAERYAGTVEPLDRVAGHVPGAVNHPFSLNVAADGRFLPAAELRARWQARLGDFAPSDVIAMCGSGVTACHNLLSLEVAGLRGGTLYAGSWSEWIRDPARPVAVGAEPDAAARKARP
jgi:thiosulfate/3-mercaptopyruvate sulfurtransferase